MEPETAKQQIVKGLVNTSMSAEKYPSSELYHSHIFEQYKLYVEMADKISERRNLLNAFFLTLHSIFLTGLGLANSSEMLHSFEHKWIIFLPGMICVSLCYIWWRLIISYGQLNSAKYKVIGEFEKLLPTSPYWSAEWNSLGKGENKKLYWPVSKLETRVPIAFAILYILGAIWFTIS